MYECLNRFTTAVKGSFNTLSQSDEDALITDIAGGEYPISSDLYRRYSDNLRRAVDAVPITDTDLQAQWHANVSRFAAYKAYHATQGIRSAVREDGDIERGRTKLHAYNRYQAAEYNTTVARARTGKQWQQFNEPDNLRLFPNMQWIPSRSADPREEHMPFYHRIWPKNDPFWDHNQPGTLWNCKCDWEQTDEEPTAGNPTQTVAAPGLAGNPAKTGEIFSDTAPYIRRANADVPTHAIRTARNVIRDQYANYNTTFDTQMGKILCDNITIQEITKGAKTDQSYFYKQEIARNFDKYADMLVHIGDEEIDLSHNNHNNIYYRRKSQFNCMKVYRLSVHDFDFQIKMGEFANGTYNLYAITEP